MKLKAELLIYYGAVILGLSADAAVPDIPLAESLDGDNQQHDFLRLNLRHHHHHHHHETEAQQAQTKELIPTANRSRNYDAERQKQDEEVFLEQAYQAAEIKELRSELSRVRQVLELLQQQQQQQQQRPERRFLAPGNPGLSQAMKNLRTCYDPNKPEDEKLAAQEEHFSNITPLHVKDIMSGMQGKQDNAGTRTIVFYEDVEIGLERMLKFTSSMTRAGESGRPGSSLFGPGSNRQLQDPDPPTCDIGYADCEVINNVIACLANPANPTPSTSCDGLNAVIHAFIEGHLYYEDSDGDGYGNARASLLATGDTQPAGSVANPDDCNDSDSSIHPGAVEVCGDGIDNDCDGFVDDEDSDCAGTLCQDIYPYIYIPNLDVPFNRWCPGFSDPQQLLPTQNELDCYNNFCDCNDRDSRVFWNGNGNECSCVYREDSTDTEWKYEYKPGLDGGLVIGADESCPTSAEISCPYEGSVCPGNDVCTTYYYDGDGDGYGNASVTEKACSVPTGYVANPDDCDDSVPEVNPGAVEVCNDGIDNDCDGVVDEGGCAVRNVWPHVVTEQGPTRHACSTQLSIDKVACFTFDCYSECPGTYNVEYITWTSIETGDNAPGLCLCQYKHDAEDWYYQFNEGYETLIISGAVIPDVANLDCIAPPYLCPDGQMCDPTTNHCVNEA